MFDRPWTGWAGLVARLGVGSVWIVAGALKLGDPAASVRAVRAYQLLPEAIVPTVGHALPAVEIAVGSCLVVGLLTRGASVVSVLMFAAFVFGISWAWAKGLSIECGCFGGGGFDKDASDDYPWEILRDVGLVLLSVGLVWLKRTRLALDNLIFPSERMPP